MDNKKLILVFTALYALVFCIFFPPFYLNADEYSYLRQAQLFRDGTSSADNLPQAGGLVFNGEGYVSMYAIGQSLYLLPFTLLGWTALFLSTLIMHLIGAFIFYKLLQRFKFDTKYTLFYLLFPPFLYYSRTLFSDLGSAVAILAAFYFYTSKENRDHIFSGLLFGIACLFRYTNLLVFLAFGLVSLFENRTRLKFLILGLIPFAALIPLVNQTLYGGILTTGYSLATGMPPFALSPAILYNALVFAGLLLALYPLMFLGPFYFRKPGRKEMILSVLAFLALFSAFEWSGSFTWVGFTIRPTDLITRTRYFIPIMSFFLLSYIPLYEKIVKRLRLPKRELFYLVILVLLAATVPLSYVHQGYLADRYSVLDQIHSNTEEGSLIIGTVDDFIYLVEPFDSRDYLDAGTEGIEDHFRENTYILYLRYSNRLGREDTLAQTRLSDREAAADLIGRLDTEPVFQAETPHLLEIHRVGSV